MAANKGDCEDIVLTKRKRLMDMGWPADLLRIAVVIDGHGDLHAVLTVDVLSQQGKPATYVLDSHFQHVEPWQYLNQYGYIWLERSKPGSTLWSRLGQRHRRRNHPHRQHGRPGDPGPALGRRRQARPGDDGPGPGASSPGDRGRGRAGPPRPWPPPPNRPSR
ncbi:MAG: transglutaminase-like cysteine peptidase [Caulobacteraceae bacterium]